MCELLELNIFSSNICLKMDKVDKVNQVKTKKKIWNYANRQAAFVHWNELLIISISFYMFDWFTWFFIVSDAKIFSISDKKKMKKKKKWCVFILLSCHDITDWNIKIGKYKMAHSIFGAECQATNEKCNFMGNNMMNEHHTHI